ncbi:response regulator transcription factor [Luteibacter sp. PPL554]
MFRTVLVADGQPLVAAGVKAVLRSHRHRVVGAAHDTDTLFAHLRDTACDLLVTELSLPSGVMPDGMPMIRRIRRQHPQVRIVLLTALAQPAVLRALRDLGVVAVFDKRSDLKHLPMAVHAAMIGRDYLSPASRHPTPASPPGRGLGSGLTPRERDVLDAYAQGHGLDAIAHTMGRSIKTISRQKRSAMAKLGLANDAQFYRYLAGLHADAGSADAVAASPPGRTACA